MQAVVQKFTRGNVVIGEINIEPTEKSGCNQVREKLDALFDGDSRLEETHAAIKRILFGHLEICQACCRMFDVRTRYSSRRGRPGIL
jgi:hypothetical protein